MNRRQFLLRISRATAAGLAVSYFPSISKASSAISRVPFDGNYSDFSPLASLNSGSFSSAEFNGDRVDRPHDILWDVSGYIQKRGGMPSISEEFDVVIVGGGISGLTAAYELRDKKVLVLDQDFRFGGNSKGEIFQSTSFSNGAAYICEPEPGSRLCEILSELKLLEKFRAEENSEVSVFLENKIANGFWSATTDLEAVTQFHEVATELLRIYNDEYPSIPLSAESQNSALLLDQISFSTWLKKNFSTVHPHIEEYFRLYAWSSFAASIDELSAAQMLNFICAETQKIMALPGGNARIATELYRVAAASGVKFHAGALALDLKVTDSADVNVCYLNAADQLVSVKAKTAIFAAPKFVATKMMSQLHPSQLAAMTKITYRAYVVANVLLNQEIASPGFDLYNLKGQPVTEQSPINTGHRSLADVCFGDWANLDEGRSVLTLYMPLPYDGARQFLFKESSHDKFKTKALNELTPLLEALNLSSESIEGIRLTRWGHALPVAKVGMLASNTAQLAASPLLGRVFFANQDNFVNPSFETAFETALVAASSVRSLL